MKGVVVIHVLKLKVKSDFLKEFSLKNECVFVRFDLKYDLFQDSQATTAELSRDIHRTADTKLERGGNFHLNFFHDLHSKSPIMVSFYKSNLQ